MIIKKAYSIQMTYDVTDDEKRQAERALFFYKDTGKLLDKASEYLNIMKTPFKDNSDIKPEDIIKARSALRRFKDKAVDNFNNFKIASFKCVNIMQSFASDTQTVKLLKSFISSIDDLEIIVNEFVDLFNDFKSKDFVKSVVDYIDKIQKQCDDIQEIIEERISPHIQNNILAKNWVDSVSNNLQSKIEKKTPLILDLFNKRQDQLNKIIKEKTQ